MLYNTIQHSASWWAINQQPLNLKSSILALSYSAALLTYLDKTDHGMLYNKIQHSGSWCGMNQQPLNLKS